MRKKLFFGIGIFLLLVSAWGIYRVTRPHKNAAGEQSSATLSAWTFYSEFISNENEADKKWVGKVITVTGIISSKNESAEYVSIILRAKPEGGVNCSMLKKDFEPGDNSKIGDSVVIKGKCTGFLVDVNMVDCVFIK